MSSVKSVIVWASTALTLYFLLHPTYVLEVRTASGWTPAGANYSAWLWSPPDASAGGRFRPDLSGAAIYSVLTGLTAAAALAGLAFESRRRPGRAA